jgi:8-oxo-dGTP diphosphatase
MRNSFNPCLNTIHGEPMNRHYPKIPIPAVGIIIYRDKKVLIIKRAYEPSKNRWSIPGGVIEIGEKVRHAAIREVKEELGLDVHIKDVVDVLDNIVYEKNKIKFHFVLIDFLATVIKGTITPNHECLDVKWVGKHELSLYDLTNGAKKAIEKGFTMVKD